MNLDPPTAVGAGGQSAARIISARLHILQSRRLIQSSVHRIVKGSTANPDEVERLNRLKSATERAHRAYESTVLALGSPQGHDYWLVAYSRLISSASPLASKLRASAAVLSPAERYEVTQEAEALEELIQRWTDSLRKSMTEAVA